MPRTNVAVLLLVATVFAVGSGQDCHSFVSNNGTDSPSHGGTASAPFATVQYAVTYSQGPNICIDSGTYNEDIHINRTVHLLGHPFGGSLIERRPVISGTLKVSSPLQTTLNATFAFLRFVARVNDSYEVDFEGRFENIQVRDCVMGPHRQLTQKIKLGLIGLAKYIEVLNCSVVVPFVELRFTNTERRNDSHIIVSDIETVKFPHWQFYEFFLGATNFGSVVISNSSFAKLSAVAAPLNSTDTPTLVTISNNVMGFSVLNRTARVVVVDVIASQLIMANNNVSAGIAIYDEDHLSPSPYELRPSWFWRLHNNYIEGFIAIAGFSTIVETSQIELRYNQFLHSSGIALTTIPFDSDVFIDAKQNWFSSETGPASCCNPGGVGAPVGWGVDFSNFCLDEQCTAFSDTTASDMCVLQQRCNNGEIAMFSVVGGLMLVLVGLATWLFFRWQESIPPERKQITLFKLMFIALAVTSAVGLVCCILVLTAFECNDPNSCFIVMWVPIAPVAFQFAVHIGSSAVALIPALCSLRAIRLHFIAALVCIIFGVIFLPVTLSMMPVLFQISNLVVFVGFPGVVLEEELWEIPYQVYVCFGLTLPCIILQILAAHYSWKLSVEYNQPELAKLQREMRESQYLLGAQAKLKSDGHLRPMARKLAIAIIPLVVRFFCLLSLISIASLAACIWFQVDLRTYIFSPEQNAYGFFLIANHATFSIGIIVISFGALVALLRRFYDSNLLWAYVVCGIVLAVLGGADIVLSLTFTANQLNRDQLLNPMAEGVAIASIVFVILMFLYQSCLVVAAFVFRRHVDNELPSILQNNIDKAFSDLYDGTH